MKLMKTVKKIMALGTGAVMVGATVLSASAAADLANYPAPFVKDGKFNGLLVVGDSANAADVLGSVDIATSLQFAARVKKTVQTTAAGSVSVSGEAWRVGTSAKKLEMSANIGSGAASTYQETVRNITTFITDDELPVLLADGTFRNSKGDYDYHQYIYFDNVNTQTTTSAASLSVIYAEDPDTDETADYFYVKNSDRIARYGLEFTTSAESDVTTSAGSASTTGTYLWSYEGKDLVLLGKTYSIVKARRTSSTGNSAELTLMGGSQKDTLAEGESKTYTVGGKDYDVSLDFVGSTTAKFTVNSELTDSLSEGDTYTLSDKSLIGVKDILVQDFAGGVRSVEFYVGANKIFLKDTDISRVGSGSQSLEVGTVKVDDTKVTIEGSDDNSTFKIDKISLNITADDDLYVPAGAKLSAQMEKPDAFMGAWDFEYQGLETVTTENMKVSRSGSNQYDLVFVNGDGNEVSVPLAYTSGGTNLSLGDNSNALVITENTTIARNDYFLVTDISQQQGDRRTYAVRYKGASAFTDSSPVIKFQVLGESGTKEEVLTNGAGDVLTGTVDATLKLGGATYNVWNATVGTADFNIMVDLNGNGVVDDVGVANGTGTQVDIPVTTANIINVTTKSGAQILIQPYPLNSSYLKIAGSVPMSAINLSVQTPNSDDYDNVAPTPIAVDITAASGKVQFTESTNTVGGDVNYLSPQGESNTNYAYTSMGAKVKWDNPSNDPDTLEVTYPTVQRLPLVYITAPGAEISTGEASEGGQIVYYETSPISVGTAKFAAEVTVAAQNTIIIGGPCANAAAAEVMGMPTPCGKDFSVGKAMINLYEQSNGNVAMLVAGYDAADTRRAARVVANYAQWQDSGKLKGTAVEVSGTSFTDISVAAPAPKPVEVPVEASTETTTTVETTTTTTTTE